MTRKGVGVGVGFCFGLTIGVALGAALQNLALGVAFGAALSVVFGLIFIAASGAPSDEELRRKRAAADKPLPHPLGLWER